MSYCLVNFGGPRFLEEVAPFLTELLSDRDVVRTNFPTLLHNWMFGRIAKKRAEKTKLDYAMLGGKSPIYEDTEAVAIALRERLQAPVLTFHRYLPITHADSLRAIEECGAEEIRVVPMFPQFTYATTGSIARLFAKRLSRRTVKKLRWTPSYPTHPGFIASWTRRIGEFLHEHKLDEKSVILLFSAHGIPRAFVETGDPYERECTQSFEALRTHFPRALCRLSYQSKFGRGEWLRPYTDETCAQILHWNKQRTHIVVVPLSFTSDHIETLFEIEELYLPVLRKQGLTAHRCPALNREAYWLDALSNIAKSAPSATTRSLIA